MTSVIDMAPILSLPVAQRFEVIGAIWDSIADEKVEVEESDELIAELIRRREDAFANPEDCVPWEQVRDAAAARRRG